MAPNTPLIASRLTLANGVSIPQIHLGVYQMTGSEAYKAVQWALAAGYRGIDSAQMYRNENECGRAILDFINDKTKNKVGLRREDVHFTTKLMTNGRYETVRKSIKNSVKTCGLGYVDLFLLHSPYGGKTARLSSWKAVEDAVQEGEIRIGGVSNFGIKHLEEMIASKPSTLPAVNQIEVHPFNTRTNITSFCQKHDIVVQAYGPLVRALKMKHPTIVELSDRYGCTPAQLMVRWSIQHGYIPLPKSVTKERIERNVQIDAFEISNDDMKTMDNLDEYLVTDWDPVDTD